MSKLSIITMCGALSFLLAGCNDTAEAKLLAKATGVFTQRIELKKLINQWKINDPANLAKANKVADDFQRSKDAIVKGILAACNEEEIDSLQTDQKCIVDALSAAIKNDNNQAELNAALAACTQKNVRPDCDTAYNFIK